MRTSFQTMPKRFLCFIESLASGYVNPSLHDLYSFLL
jgi:hypothetical protein